jgi:uncharacterized protein (TIGR03083 family)
VTGRGSDWRRSGRAGCLRAADRSGPPCRLVCWFHDGAADLAERFRATAPGEQVWTWSADHTVGFWQRMLAIEAAVHRWDAENAVGAARQLDTALAADAIAQTFEFMAPLRRTARKAPPGHGERFAFQRTDRPGTWAVQFDGAAVLLGTPDGHYDIQISGIASDLALFLWQHPVTGNLDIQGDTSLLSRYFTLVPPFRQVRESEMRMAIWLCRCDSHLLFSANPGVSQPPTLCTAAYRSLSSACHQVVTLATKLPTISGGSARGYQALFVPLAALSGPGYSPMDGKPAVYIAGLRPSPTRHARAG